MLNTGVFLLNQVMAGVLVKTTNRKMFLTLHLRYIICPLPNLNDAFLDPQHGLKSALADTPNTSSNLTLIEGVLKAIRSTAFTAKESSKIGTDFLFCTAVLFE